MRGDLVVVTRGTYVYWDLDDPVASTRLRSDTLAVVIDDHPSWKKWRRVMTVDGLVGFANEFCFKVT